RLLLRIFNKALAVLLLTTLFGGQGFAQSSGYGDFIIFEDFGRAIRNHNPNHPSQEYYSSSENADGGEVYFRKEQLSDIDENNLLFYRPGNPPWQYWAGGGLTDEKNWGPQYINDSGVQIGSYSI